MDELETEYDRLFDALAEMAADLHIPPDDADELIQDVLLSTLVNRHINDIDAWTTAAFLSVVRQRGGRPS